MGSFLFVLSEVLKSCDLTNLIALFTNSLAKIWQKRKSYKSEWLQAFEKTKELVV
jgi:hypothetical protein